MSTQITTHNPVRSDLTTPAAAAAPGAPASRGWAVAGIVSGVAGIGAIVASSLVDAVYDPAIEGDTAAIADKLSTQTGPLFAFHSLALVSAVLLLVFGAGLLRRLRDEIADGLAPMVAFAGLAGTAVVQVIGTSLAAAEEEHMSTIRVVAVDDHQIVRDGLTALLGALEGVEVVGAAADGREALHVVDEVAPDVVVMDIQMPRLDGIEATRFIVSRHPDVRVVMLTMNEDDDTVLSAIRAGACGYLLKGSGAAEVHTAIQAAATGGMVFGAALAGRVAAFFAGASASGARAEDPFPDLTDRERSILHMLAAGRSNDAIAAELYVSNKTVRNSVSAIYAKLHAAGRSEAIVKAREAGYGRD